MTDSKLHLYPCPFCGYSAEVLNYDEHEALCSLGDMGKFITIQCTGCGCVGPSKDKWHLYDKDKAILLWNYRVKKGMVRPKPEPRYDDVYYSGVKYLNGEFMRIFDKENTMIVAEQKVDGFKQEWPDDPDGD